MKKLLYIGLLLFSFLGNAQIIFPVGTGNLGNTDAQQISLSGNTLTLGNGGTVNLAPYLDNTDGQTVTDLSLSGNILSITLSGGNTATVNLTGISGGTGNQTLSEVLTEGNDATGLDLINTGTLTPATVNENLGSTTDPFNIAFVNALLIKNNIGAFSFPNYNAIYTTGNNDYTFTKDDTSNNFKLNIDAITTNVNLDISDTDIQFEEQSLLPSATDEADEITYDNTTSGLTATDVKGALDELAGASGTDSGQGLDLNPYTTTPARVVYSNSNVTEGGSATGKRGFNRHGNDTIDISPVSIQKTTFRVQSTKDSVIVERPSDTYFITYDSIIKNSDWLAVKKKDAAFFTYLKDSSTVKLYQVDIANYSVGNYEVVPTFPPSGQLVDNGDFENGSTGWDLVFATGSTAISGGTAIIDGQGALPPTAGNHEIRQADVFEAASGGEYTVGFRARYVSGSGNFYVGQNFTAVFSGTLTGSFADYEVTGYIKPNTDARFLTLGADLDTDVEIEYIYAIKTN